MGLTFQGDLDTRAQRPRVVWSYLFPVAHCLTKLVTRPSAGDQRSPWYLIYITSTLYGCNSRMPGTRCATDNLPGRGRPGRRVPGRARRHLPCPMTCVFPVGLLYDLFLCFHELRKRAHPVLLLRTPPNACQRDHSVVDNDSDLRIRYRATRQHCTAGFKASAIHGRLCKSR